MMPAITLPPPKDYSIRHHDDGSVSFFIKPDVLRVTDLDDVTRLEGILQDFSEELADAKARFLEESETDAAHQRGEAAYQREVYYKER